METSQSGNWGRGVAAPSKREVGLGGSRRVRPKVSRLKLLRTPCRMEGIDPDSKRSTGSSANTLGQLLSCLPGNIRNTCSLLCWQAFAGVSEAVQKSLVQAWRSESKLRKELHIVEARRRYEDEVEILKACPLLQPLSEKAKAALKEQSEARKEAGGGTAGSGEGGKGGIHTRAGGQHGTATGPSPAKRAPLASCVRITWRHADAGLAVTTLTLPTGR